MVPLRSDCVKLKMAQLRGCGYDLRNMSFRDGPNLFCLHQNVHLSFQMAELVLLHFL